jgi:hypothetical protein
LLWQDGEQQVPPLRYAPTSQTITQAFRPGLNLADALVPRHHFPSTINEVCVIFIFPQPL